MDSGHHKLSENTWFVWSKRSYNGNMVGCGLVWFGLVEEIYIDKIALTLCRNFRQETVWVKPELVVEQIMAFVLHFLKIE